MYSPIFLYQLTEKNPNFHCQEKRGGNWIRGKQKCFGEIGLVLKSPKSLWSHAKQKKEL